MWRKKYLTILLVAGLAGTAFLQGCKKSDSSSKYDAQGTYQNPTGMPESQTAKVNMHIADDPAMLYDAVYIDIQQLKVKMDSNNAWIIINVARPGLYNLMDLRNGIDTVLSKVMLPPGHIKEVRLILGPNSYVLVDSVKYPLGQPSEDEDELRIDMDDIILAGGTYDIFIDFDLGSSLHNDGDEHHRHFTFRPVIRLFNSAKNGKIEGMVLPTTALAVVYATNTTNSSKTYAALPDASGFYMFTGLPAGTYNLTFTPSIITFHSVTMNNVTVQYNTVTDLGTITLN